MIMLRSLKLYGMANAVEDLVAQGGPSFEAATPMLSQLLKAEIAEREVRSITYQTKVARFPSYKDLAGFEFKSSDINEATVKQLHRCEFMENAENVVLIGGPGTGKSHVATAIGVQAIEHHRCKVRFYSTVELVNALEQEKALGKTGKMAEMMTNPCTMARLSAPVPSSVFRRGISRWPSSRVRSRQHWPPAMPWWPSLLNRRR